MLKYRPFDALLILLTIALVLLLPLRAWPASGEDDEREDVPDTAATTVSTTASSPVLTDEPADGDWEESFLVLESDGKTVTSIDARTFLIWTVAAEMPALFEEEALKAQAVASYTYFCYERAAERQSPTEALCGADFADTPVDFPAGYTESYWRTRWGSGYDEYYRKVAAAVDAVAGVQILYNGAPIFAAYHAISNGTTEVPEQVWSAAFPYLQSVDSSLDKQAPQYLSTVTLTAAEFQQAMAGVEGIQLAGDAAGWVADDAVYTSAGNVLSQTVGGVSLTGRQWRSLCGLRSSCFTVSYANGAFTFEVKGYGHGVGMSQYGAQYLAKAGYTWEEILHHYYTDVEIA